MKILNNEELILLNGYAQGIRNVDEVLEWYNGFNENIKHDIIVKIWGITIQARAKPEDIELARENARLKHTHTPVRMLCKESVPFYNRGYDLAKLKGKEQEQAFKLVLECFTIAEQRRKHKCDTNKKMCNHWWHKDLSNPEIVKKIINDEL